ncbi:MAG TPA: VCBS repeat-containing protein, partial [Myxococcota bacterium]|nr:VCBS repeat-containing protein [Myxococcota bacterium]
TIYNADGSIRIQDGSPDGPCAAADFDLDGSPEWVHVSSGTVYLSDLSGTVRWASAVPQGGGGPPTVADFDADGYPEVGVAGAYYYVVFDNDGSILWQNPVQDYSSSVTGSSVFDFEGDGKADVVYADEVILWVFDGATGAIKLQEDNHASGTLYEYPLIVDVDNDGATEVVLASNNYGFPGWNGISVIGDMNGSWRPSRPIWNQYAYNIRNVEDDGSIPRHPDAFWKSFNNFRTGGTSLGLGSELADLEPGEPEVCCGQGEVELWVPVSNRGLAASGLVELRVTAGGQRLYSEELELNPGAGRHVGPITITKAEWNTPVKVWVDREEQIEECVEDNNVIELGAWPCD